jgi:trimeric autotransporter adhesin
MHAPLPLRWPSLLVLFAMLPIAAQGPCGNTYLPGPALSGADGRVAKLRTWDPDGPGPKAPQVLATGTFGVAGAAFAQGLASYDPAVQRWSGLGVGLPGHVYATANRPNGNLVVASANMAFEWTGASWQALGTFWHPLLTVLSSIAVLANGDVVVSGLFQSVDGTPANGLARWDGVAWQSFGDPSLIAPIQSMVVLPNGDLVVAGWFTQIGGVPVTNVARWDGTAWSPLGAGIIGPVGPLLAMANGDIVARGGFATATGVSTLARWDGSVWNDLLVGLSGQSGEFAEMPNGNLLVFAGNELWQGGPGAWTSFAPWPGLPPHTIHVASANDVLVGGEFVLDSRPVAHNVARWNGAAWQATNPGSDGPVLTVASLADGSLLVAGDFQFIDGQPANRIARRVGSNWVPIPSNAMDRITKVLPLPGGEVLLEGVFRDPTTSAAHPLAIWNGSTVAPFMPAALANLSVQGMALAANGDVLWTFVDAVSSGIVRWDGSTFVATPLAIGDCRTFLELPNGDLLFAPSLLQGQALLRWDGVQLSSFGTPLTGWVHALALDAQGDVLVAGSLPAYANIIRWDGATWQPLGNGLPTAVTSLAPLPNGELLATQDISGLFPSTLLRRWDGFGWTQVDRGWGSARVAWMPNGDIVLHGDFTNFGGEAHNKLALLVANCPARVIDRGGACSSAAGLLQLTAPTGAWIGAPLTTRCRHLPSGALALANYGLAPLSLPLAQLTPLGGAGCALLASLDLTILAAVQNGVATATASIPPSPALVGATFEHQIFALEFGFGGALTAIRSSNALQLQVGAL